VSSSIPVARFPPIFCYPGDTHVIVASGRRFSIGNNLRFLIGLKPSMAQPENGWEATVVGERHFYIPGIAITLEVLSTIFFAFRLWSRFSQSGGKAGVDDGFLIAGWVFGTALTISIIICESIANACYTNN
jgi:hypothetical protein